MSATRLPARCPAPVASLPTRGSAWTLTFSMPKTLTFSMPIDRSAGGAGNSVPNSHAVVPFRH